MPEPRPPDARLRVLLTGVTNNSGLAIARNLGRAGFHVIGASVKLLPLGLHSRYSEPYHRYPIPNEPDFAERLIELATETRPDVFLPTGTASVGVVSQYRERFDNLTAVNVPPYEQFLVASDRARTMEECCSRGIPCPQVLTLEEAKRLLEAASGGPEEQTVVVKPRQDRGGGRGVSYCRDVGTLLRRMEECNDQFGEPILQEYIPGGADAMRTAIVLFDRQARLAAYFTTQKLRQWPVTGGITAMSVSTDDRDLLSQVLRFFENREWQGLAEVELKVDPRDGKAKLIEVNPRFCNYIGFPARCGLNFPVLAVLAAADRLKSDGCPPYAVGVRYMNTMLYLKAVRAEYSASQHKLRVLRRAWREIRRGAVRNSVDLSDPLPRLGKLASEVMELVSGLKGGKAGGPHTDVLGPLG